MILPSPRRHPHPRHRPRLAASRRLLSLAPLLLTIVLAACDPGGQRHVAYPLVGHGADKTLKTMTADGWQVTFSEARLGFGPLYLCATAAASADLCPSALAELTETVEIDLLNPKAQHLGQITGVSGVVHSATWDYGLSWFTTDHAAHPNPGAPDGHSAVFRGVAQKGGKRLAFSLALDVRPQHRGSRVVQGAQTTWDVQNDQVTLHLDCDLSRWWRDVGFDAVADLPGAATALADPKATLVLDDANQIINPLVLGMTANARPILRWTTP